MSGSSNIPGPIAGRATGPFEWATGFEKIPTWPASEVYSIPNVRSTAMVTVMVTSDSMVLITMHRELSLVAT